jgi:hypothetical protein
METNTNNPFQSVNPVNPELSRLLTDAARRLGLDATTTARVAREGAVMIDDVNVVTIGMPSNVLAGNDTMAVASLGELRLTTTEQAQAVLNTNLVLGPLSGFTFGTTQEGELHLFSGMKQAEIDGESLAQRLLQMAKVAASVREELKRIAAGTTASSTAKKKGALS